MAKRNTLKLDTSGLTELLTKLDAVGGDMKPAAEEALKKASERIADDTETAIQKVNLPAHGKYSTGDTEKSIIRNAQVEWNGLVGSVPVGFDFSKAGAGGYLITGTPKMKPDKELRKIYKGKKYMQELQEKMQSVIRVYIGKAMNK